ncbi:hypothetical protein KIN20_005215 [Parelaphostrongylus tenuis]|uniref:G-protein coupled receptors family 1 profile domain-containing protein n=1 Tax=Parelaphostrongylus tenuis TaxID=148309 RepID=A0AAD5MKX8_PARTN|nr:hypothetical protein KIN20_005215 [Parelaphostrongylus tenuis]
MASTVIPLIVEIIIVFLQLVMVICNGFTVFLFKKYNIHLPFREKSLRQNSSMLMVLLLATTDFLHAITTLPYSIYLISSWNPDYLNLNPYYILIGSAPFFIHLKISLTLIICIAADRILVLYFPIMYHKLSSHSYAKFCLSLGIALGVLDLILEFSTTPIKNSENCPSIGCFISDSFSYYMGTSNMVMGVIMFVLTTLILIKLHVMRQKPQRRGTVTTSREKLLKQSDSIILLLFWINRECAGILITSLLFVTLPSIGIGICSMTGCQISRSFGPLYFFALLCAGVCNNVMHVALNKNIRESVVKSIKKHAYIKPVYSIKRVCTKPEIRWITII